MKLGKQRNQCQGCKEYFNSNAAFDKHRTGPHGHGRRCRTPDEMTAVGMSKNQAGFWVTQAYDGFRDKEKINETTQSS
jgi:hypothetical protein